MSWIKRHGWHYRPLTGEQQLLVVAHLDAALKVARGVWASSALCATDLEELQSEAYVELCQCAIRYKAGKWTFEEVAKFQIRRHLWNVIDSWRKKSCLPLIDAHNIAEDPENDSADIQAVIAMLAALPEVQRKVIELKYGLLGPAITTTQISEQLGLARSPVHRAEQRGLNNLRLLLRGGISTELLTVAEIKKRLSRGGDRRSKNGIRQERPT